MLLSDLIAKLQAIQELYGDHPVYVNGEHGINDSQLAKQYNISYCATRDDRPDNLEDLDKPFYHIGGW